MTADGKPMRPIWLAEDQRTVQVIDQRRLPHAVEVLDLESVDDVIAAIREMVVRGAPLIGVTAAYGVFLAALNSGTSGQKFRKECTRIRAARPTAVNLAWAVTRMRACLEGLAGGGDRLEAARSEAARIAEIEVDNCRRIGEHGVTLIQEVALKKPGEPVNILTHCNAGWLACIEYGTATAPIYMAAEQGIPLHVWVDETRPLNQGSRLTAWELGEAGIRHTVVTDNAGGHLMQHAMVDLVIVGSDRTTHTGDVANKIGTYLKALAARDNGVPFYVALPSSTLDWELSDGVRDIPIEARDPDEVRYVEGWDGNRCRRILVPPAKSPAANFAFDVTPARLVSGIITERGICAAEPAAIRELFPDKWRQSP